MAALQPRSVGGPPTARLTRREDRSAQHGRCSENFGNRAAANYRFLNRLSRICRLHPVSRPASTRKPAARPNPIVATGCAYRPAYISSHDAHERRSFEQRRGAASQRGETGHQHSAAAPILVDAEAERAAGIKGAGSHGQDSKLVSPLADSVSAPHGHAISREVKDICSLMSLLVCATSRPVAPSTTPP
jgi:hypothetical protein